MKEKKCSSCGSTHLRKTSDLLYYENVRYDYVPADTFVCLECGHVDIFAEENSTIMEKTKIAIAKENELQTLYDGLEKELELHKLNLKKAKEQTPLHEAEIKRLQKLLANEDISVREHKQIEESLKIAETDLKRNQSEINKCESFITESYAHYKERIRAKGHR